VAKAGIGGGAMAFCVLVKVRAKCVFASEDEDPADMRPGALTGCQGRRDAFLFSLSD
jgi:hypothetical protein